MLRRIIGALCALLLASASAWGQGSVLQAGPPTGGHAPMYTPGGSYQTVIQDSGPASGGKAGLGLSELLGVSQAPTVSSGTGPLGTHACWYSAPVTSGAYYYLCFDPNAQGGGLIAYGNAGTAPQLPFQFFINGVSGPTTGNASAWTVTANSITNTLAGWMGYLSGSPDPTPLVLQGQSTAAITSDTTQLTVGLNNPTMTASHIFNCTLSAGCASTSFNADAIRGVATNTAGSTAPFIVNGVAGYVYNNQPGNAGYNVTAALDGFSVCAANGSQCWGIDTLQIDNSLGLQVSAGTGRALYNEFDFNVTSTGTTGTGLQLAGIWLAQPTGGVNGFAVQTPYGASGAGPSAPFAKWDFAFFTQNGAATVGATFGALAYTAAANIGSQPIFLSYFDSSSVNQAVTLQADTSGDFNISSTATTANLFLAKGSIYLPTMQGLLVNFNAVVSADSGANAYFGTGASFTAINIGNGTGAVDVIGQVNLNSATPLGLTATTGFVGLPYTSGIPTGAPAAAINCAIDVTNSYLNCYYSGGWHKIAFTSGAG